VTLLLMSTMLSATAGAAFMTTAVGRQALIDQWERAATAFGQPMDDADYKQLQQLSDQAGVGYAVVSALISGPALTLGIAGLLRVTFGNHATFQQTLAVATHAGVILALRQVVAAPVSYLRETTSSATNLGTLFSSLDEASPVARFLGVLDGFVIWWAIVLAIGVSVLYHRRARTVAVTFVGIYAGLALLLAMAMAVTAGSA